MMFLAKKDGWKRVLQEWRFEFGLGSCESVLGSSIYNYLGVKDWFRIGDTHKNKLCLWRKSNRKGEKRRFLLITQPRQISGRRKGVIKHPFSVPWPNPLQRVPCRDWGLKKHSSENKDWIFRLYDRFYTIRLTQKKMSKPWNFLVNFWKISL